MKCKPIHNHVNVYLFVHVARTHVTRGSLVLHRVESCPVVSCRNT